MILTAQNLEIQVHHTHHLVPLSAFDSCCFRLNVALCMTRNDSEKYHLPFMRLAATVVSAYLSMSGLSPPHQLPAARTGSWPNRAAH